MRTITNEDICADCKNASLMRQPQGECWEVPAVCAAGWPAELFWNVRSDCKQHWPHPMPPNV
jgi:hypothetical protein